MQNFFSSINRYVLKALFNQVSNVILHFFFVFALVCTAIVHEKLYQSLNQFSAKIFFFYIFFLIKGEGLKRRIQKLFAEASFFIINLDDKTKLSFYPSLPFRTDAKAQFLQKLTPFIQFFALQFYSVSAGLLVFIITIRFGQLVIFPSVLIGCWDYSNLCFDFTQLKALFVCY